MTIFLTNENFDAPEISYGFFGRNGGVSEGIYNSLNVGLGSNDDPALVHENRNIIRQNMGIDNLSTLYQIHSNISHVIDAPLTEVREGDAFVTKTPRVAIGILTADCGPILFHGQSDSGPVIGAAHAGWGGAVKGILESTIDKMLSEGAELSSIKAMIGPCIGPQIYEVSKNFLDPFLVHNKTAVKFFNAKINTDTFLFDLPAYIEFRLRHRGVQTIIQSGIDTYTNDQDYFSYRRKTHKLEPDYGRQMAVIVIK